MIENEVKILDIDVDEISEALARFGYTKKPELLYRRIIFNTYPVDPNKWVRLRTDGTDCTLTYKNFREDAIDGVDEIEVTVSDFDNCERLLKHDGLQAVSYQENKRTPFVAADCEAEVSIDRWPNIPPYLEIEADSVEKVHDVIKKLGVDKMKKTSATTQEVYRSYGIDISNLDIIRF